MYKINAAVAKEQDFAESTDVDIKYSEELLNIAVLACDQPVSQHWL